MLLTSQVSLFVIRQMASGSQSFESSAGHWVTSGILSYQMGSQANREFFKSNELPIEADGGAMPPNIFDEEVQIELLVIHDGSCTGSFTSAQK